VVDNIPDHARSPCLDRGFHGRDDRFGELYTNVSHASIPMPRPPWHRQALRVAGQHGKRQQGGQRSRSAMERGVFGLAGSRAQRAMPFAVSGLWTAGKRLSVVGEVGVPVKQERRKAPESWRAGERPVLRAVAGSDRAWPIFRGRWRTPRGNAAMPFPALPTRSPQGHPFQGLALFHWGIAS